MSVMQSTMLPLGTSAPDFNLPDTDGVPVSLDYFRESPALLVIFMCNHCPFVKHVLKGLVEIIKEYQAKGVAVVAINSNDINNYPEDSPENMARLAKDNGFTFPYLYDESQQVAKAYHASCTPDFFLFDRKRKLFYRGQMDSSRPQNKVPVTGADLRAAMDVVLKDGKAPINQKPSMGCSIKWKKEQPDYSI